MAIQTFTSGQVLTAAQVNALQSNDFNQTVTTKTADYTPTTTTDIGTRLIMNSASATTITINTSIYSAGDTLFLSNIGAGVCTLTAGTCTITSAGPLAIPQYGGGLLYFTSASAAIYYPTAVTIPAASSGLTLISAGSKTSATTHSFNSIFTTTYRNYKVIFSQITTSTNNQQVQMRVGTSGTPFTGSNYQYNTMNNSGGGTLGSSSALTTTNILIVPNSGVSNNFTEFTINSPFQTERTIISAQSLGTRATFIPETFTPFVHIDTATSYTDLSVTTSGGANFTLNYAIYGYAES